MAKKIMFSDKYGLTKAVLDGRKTQTRRVAFKDSDEVHFYDFGTDPKGRVYACFPRHDGEWQHLIYPNYQPGEVVAVAQSYRDIYEMVNGSVSEDYRFSAWLKKDMFDHKGWNNKMFVRPGDMPSFIEIANIRVERLQGISVEDCLKEGIKRFKRGFTYEQPGMMYGFPLVFDLPKYAFASLIDKTCGKGTWDNNPWMFVYDFKLVKR